MSAPDNEIKLQTILELVNFYTRFIPRLYDLKAPLNKLLQKTKNCAGQNNTKIHSQQ